MLKYPLIEHWFPTKIEGARPPSSACTACPMYQTSSAVCLGEGDPPRGGGVLVVYGQPTTVEGARGLAFSGALAEGLKKKVEGLAKGRPVHCVHAVRCAGEIHEDAIAACRPHLWFDWFAQKPERVIAVGADAVRAIFGLYFDAWRVRRGWAMYQGVPVFLVADPSFASHNRFYAVQLREDLKWAVESPIPAPLTGDVSVLETIAEVDEYLQADGWLTNMPTVIDVEHDGTLWDPNFRMLCVGLCRDPQHPVVIPADVAIAAKDVLCRWLKDWKIPKINHNIKHDRHALYRFLGVDMEGIAADTMLRAGMLETEARVGLAAQSWTVGFGGYKEAAAEEEDEEIGGVNKWARMGHETLCKYNGRDTAATLLLHHSQVPRMGRLEKTWENLTGPAFSALTIVERNGIKVSKDATTAYDTWLGVGLDACLDKIKNFEGVPADFNPSKRMQVVKLLYETLKIPCKGKTPKGAQSVSEEALNEIKSTHPIIPLILEHSELRTQRNRYGLPVLEYISPVDGRIHTTYKQARSSRLRSYKPAMQNITRSNKQGDAGSWARGCYVADEGNVLIDFDYSQLELRVAAMLSQDAAMIKAFVDDIDFHSLTASIANEVDFDKVTKQQRNDAKPLNFAIVYGGSAYLIASEIGCSVAKAESLMDSMLRKYKQLAEWRTKQVTTCNVSGNLRVAWDPCGWFHNRDMSGVGETGYGKAADRMRKHWQNAAINTPVQCVANQIALASLVEVVRWTQEEMPEVRLILTVHDSLMLEAPARLVDQTVSEVRRIMLQWDTKGCPLKVDVKVGLDWGHLEKYKEPVA